LQYKEIYKQMAIENKFLYNINTATCFDIARLNLAAVLILYRAFQEND
jgi:hypothetical protein